MQSIARARRVRHLPPATLALAAVTCAALTACGGGGGESTPPTVAPAPTYLEGPVGQMVGLAPEVLGLGTYTVSNCVNASNSSVSRKLRLSDDGSVLWLDAANNDAVLARFTPSTSVAQQRTVEVYDNGSFFHEVQEFANGSRTLQILVDPDNVRVNAGTVQDTCTSNQQVQRVVTIPVALTDAIVARKLGSAVRSTGANPTTGSLGTDENITYTDGVGAVVTSRLRRSVSAAGVISFQLDNDTPVAWTDWVNALQTSTGTRGYYSENWDTSSGTSSNTANAAGTPANPRITVELVHPTLRVQATGRNALVILRRDTTEQANGQAFMAPLGQ